MHTSPFCLLNLTETCAEYNRGGIDVLCFNIQPNRYNGIGRMIGGQFRAVRNAARRHMASVGLRASTDSAAVPPVAPIDLPQEYLLCRRVLQHARRIAATTPRRPVNDSQAMAS